MQVAVHEQCEVLLRLRVHEMSNNVPQAEDIRRDFLLFRLRAVAEIGPQILLVEFADVRAPELFFKLGPCRDTVSAGTPPASRFALQYRQYCSQDLEIR